MKKNSLGRGFLAIVLSATLLGSGCANWVDTAVADLPVITQIVTSIVTIVAGATGDPNMITEVQNICTQATTDIKTVQGLVNDYKAAAAGAKPGILAKIQAGLAAIQKDFQDILTAFHVKDTATQTAVSGGIALALTTVQAIISLMPPAASTGMPTAEKKKVAKGEQLVPRKPEELKKEFNALVKDHFPKAVI